MHSYASPRVAGAGRHRPARAEKSCISRYLIEFWSRLPLTDTNRSSGYFLPPLLPWPVLLGCLRATHRASHPSCYDEAHTKFLESSHSLGVVLVGVLLNLTFTDGKREMFYIKRENLGVVADLANRTTAMVRLFMI
jgi:hypothetical protein